MEDVFLLVRLVGDSRVVAEATGDVHLIRLVTRLHSEGASGPALAGKAVADRDREGIALRFQLKLPAVTGGFSGSHSRGTYRSVALENHVRDRTRVREAGAKAPDAVPVRVRTQGRIRLRLTRRSSLAAFRPEPVRIQPRVVHDRMRGESALRP